MTKNNKPKVAVAMSGGVDSGVAAALLVKAGFQASGFHMQLWQEERKAKSEAFINKCCSSESLEAARQTAHQLGIPFYTVRMEREFKKQVVDYFLKEYSLGRTPNPCVACNRLIKFGALLDYAKKLGYDFLATGHYSRVVVQSKSEKLKVYHLLEGKDKKKDQSYFLYNLTQEQLAHVLFPVGEYLKKEVVAMAKEWNLPVAHRPESQEVCFYPESDYRPFLKRQIRGQIKPGKVVNRARKVIGEHQGLPLYTIGQRHGFKIITKRRSDLMPPFYVIAKRTKKNQLVVGFGKETEVKEFVVRDVNWINQQDTKCLALDIRVRIRHQGKLLKAKAERDKRAKKVKVFLVEGERGVAPGQAAVFYKRYGTGSYEVLGGGIIEISSYSRIS